MERTENADKQRTTTVDNRPNGKFRFKLAIYGAAAALALTAFLSGCAVKNTPAKPLAAWASAHPESVSAAKPTSDGPVGGVRAADFIPAHGVYRVGYRPGIPLYSPSLDFLDCEGFDSEQIDNIYLNFAWPLIAPNDAEYSLFIDTVVVKGVDKEPEKTTFTIWLFDGRHLDSGPLFTDKHGKQISFDHHKMGAAMYARAMQMMKKEIPAWKLKASENPWNWPWGPESVSPVRGVLAADFIPYIGRYHEGYRSGIPLQSPFMDYLDCEGLEMADIQKHFAAPLIDPDHGKYSAFIGAVVVKAVCNESEETTFTIWLLDGRHLDSGPVFVDKNGNQLHFDDLKMGAAMYARAMRLLKKAIPAWKIKAAEHAEPGTGPEPY